MPVVLHLHPDFPYRHTTVLESIARDGVYRSQWTTGTSNGGLTAVPGGDRARWETRLFQGRYDGGLPEQRPVYGAFARRTDPYGAAIRFGSAHLVLRDDCVDRATFCFPDSFADPTDVGGPELLADLCAVADAAGLDDLDDYVEAQVHGRVDVDRDVEAVVLDPCFRDTAVHDAAARLGCRIGFHPGYVVRTADLTADFRGPEPLALARHLGEVLRPDVIGAAARSREHDPQVLKKVWHLLARYGRAANT